MIKATDIRPNKLGEGIVLESGDVAAKSRQQRLKVDVRIRRHVGATLEGVVFTLLTALHTQTAELRQQDASRCRLTSS